ncbi:helix-turn-helix domain-containing protein [Acinetobacter sp. ANC 4862]|uniref:winged helix-turn-helix transcriptional regulator n=1 Tax=Acinetobacter sp. ANC 4862 TaxID=2529849 RepID=UPI001038CD22|nr:helix-turn-helix domain-containing protein [Acinetobacter sp. ANC 4862]TCH63580.1 transcriptional regulator [Acinetobacter sp. ANC 4862]
MRKNSHLEVCPIARTVSILGDAWSILILRDAHLGLTRFDQFRTSLGIAPTILTKRLSVLVQEGLLAKRQYSEHPPRDEYVLTQSGQDFLPILFVLSAWGSKHKPYEYTEQLTQFHDLENGTEIKPIVIDQVTGAEIGTRPICPKK